MRFLRYSQNQVQQQYKKSGKKLDMGKGCVRFKSLDDLALDTRGWSSGSGTRQRTRMSHAKREVGAACALLLVQRRSRDNRPVGRTVARVSAEEAHGQLPGGEGAQGEVIRMQKREKDLRHRT